MAQPKIQPAAQQAIKRHPVQVRVTFLRLPRQGSRVAATFAA